MRRSVPQNPIVVVGATAGVETQSRHRNLDERVVAAEEGRQALKHIETESTVSDRAARALLLLLDPC